VTLATLSAVILFLAALLQSLSYLCSRLPETRRPTWYPRNRLALTLIDISWLLLCILGNGAAFSIDLWLGLVAVALYFLALPFLFQSALARLMGFRDLRELVELIDHHA